MQWIRTIAKNTFYQIVARLVSSGSSFLIAVVVANRFGFGGYGDFAKVTSFVSLFYLLSDFGLNAIFLQRDDAKLHFKDLFYPRIIISLILMGLVIFISLLFPYNDATGVGFSHEVRLGILLFSLTILTESMMTTAAAIFQRELTYKFFMLANAVGSVITLVLVLLFTSGSQMFLSIFIAFVIGGLFESFLALWLTKEKLLPLSINISYAKKLLADAFPVTLMLLFNLIYFRIDIIILSFFRTSHDVGVYDLAYKVFDFLIALPLFLSNSLYPKLLLDEKNNQKKNLSTRYLALFIISAFVIVIPVWFFSPIVRLFKREFLEAVSPLRILLVSLPVFFGTSILQWLLIARKKQKFLSWVYAVSTVLNIVANLIFIPSYGYVASAIITGVSELLVFIALWSLLYL